MCPGSRHDPHPQPPQKLYAALLLHLPVLHLPLPHRAWNEQRCTSSLTTN